METSGRSAAPASGEDEASAARRIESRRPRTAKASASNERRTSCRSVHAKMRTYLGIMLTARGCRASSRTSARRSGKACGPCGRSRARLRERRPAQGAAPRQTSSAEPLRCQQLLASADTWAALALVPWTPSRDAIATMTRIARASRSPAANSSEVSPQSFQRSTRFAHPSRVSFGMQTAGRETYATAQRLSGTRLVKQIPSTAGQTAHSRACAGRAAPALGLCKPHEMPEVGILGVQLIP
jgi:hypothetical protein